MFVKSFFFFFKLKRTRYERISQELFKTLNLVLKVNKIWIKQYLYDFAASEKLDIVQAGNKLFKLEEPSSQAVNDFFTKHAEHIKKPFFEIEADIKKQLTIQMAHRAKRDAISNMMVKGDLVILPKY